MVERGSAMPRPGMGDGTFMCGGPTAGDAVVERGSGIWDAGMGDAAFDLGRANERVL